MESCFSAMPSIVLPVLGTQKCLDMYLSCCKTIHSVSVIRGRRQHSDFSTSVVQRLHLVYFVCMHSTQEVVHHGIFLFKVVVPEDKYPFHIR